MLTRFAIASSRLVLAAVAITGVLCVSHPLFFAQAFTEDAQCPVTKSPDPPFIPPAPYPVATRDGWFYYGNPRLWTQVHTDWHGLPLWDIGYREKIAWWTQGLDQKSEGGQPALTITGRRLDGPSKPLIADDHANTSHSADMGTFIMSAVNLPTAGCWEITGHYKGENLTFVVMVKP